MASRTPMAANTRKARQMDAREGNLNTTIGCAADHIPMPISSLSTPEEKRRRLYWTARPTVEERFWAKRLNERR